MLWHELAPAIIAVYGFVLGLMLDAGYGYFKGKRKQRRYR
jgi:cell shape-determining protein MreD